MSGAPQLISRAIGRFVGGLGLLLLPLLSQAEVYNLPPPGSDLIGDLRYVKAGQEDTLIDIAHQFSVGQDEIVMANPTVDRWLPGKGTQVLIPRQFILPDVARNGIVVNVPEMRLYFFPGSAKHPTGQVISYPISIGRMDWRSPLGLTKVVQKIKDPAWHPPETIKREHAADGDILPDVVAPGPNNPLGRFAMRLGVPGYLIHGVDQEKADGIGMRVTHGCMRMYPEDVEKLFPQVAVGTPVNLVNQPVKVGWLGDVLYIEVSESLDEDRLSYDQLFALAMGQISKKTAQRPATLNMDALQEALRKPTGIPTAITAGAPASVQWPARTAQAVPVMPQAAVAEPIAAPAPAPSQAAPPPSPPPAEQARDLPQIY